MKIFRFDRGVAHHIAQFESSFEHQFLAIARGGEVRISIMYLGAGDRVGRHEARIAQLFAVVQGNGRVEAAGARTPIASGRAAFWGAGESHAAGTDTGMVAIVVEGNSLGPDAALAQMVD
ncbi:MAG: cupin [Dehalococcoidia bacterium]